MSKKSKPKSDKRSLGRTAPAVAIELSQDMPSPELPPEVQAANRRAYEAFRRDCASTEWCRKESEQIARAASTRLTEDFKILRRREPALGPLLVLLLRGEASADALLVLLREHPRVASALDRAFHCFEIQLRQARPFLLRAEMLERGGPKATSRSPRRIDPKRAPPAAKLARTSADGIAAAMKRGNSAAERAFLTVADAQDRYAHLDAALVFADEDPRWVEALAFERTMLELERREAPIVAKRRVLTRKIQSFRIDEATPSAARRFARDVAGEYNKLALNLRQCERCFAPFGVLDERARHSRYCGPGCKSAATARESERKQRRRSAADALLLSRQRAALMERHVSRCSRCDVSARAWCRTGTKLWDEAIGAYGELEAKQPMDLIGYHDAHMES